MKRLNITLIGLFFFVMTCGAQEGFRFKRDIGGVERKGWYTITLPPDIFTQLNPDLSDIRIFTVDGSDTLEVPYILDVQANIEKTTSVTLPVLNKSYSDGALYLMFALNREQPVNYLDIHFAESNYFGRVSVQGSDDRRQWFDIVTDKRIVSVDKGSGDNYALTRIDFPLTDYRFLRLRVKADAPLTFQSVSFRHNEVKRGSFRTIPMTWNSLKNEKTKQTIIDIRLQDYAPLSFIDVKADSTRDYYRPLRIEVVTDSFKTDKGWMKSYETLYEGHLTSFRSNNFAFPWRLAREIRMVVTNFDDQPIIIRDVAVAGPKVNIVARLEPGNNILLHGFQGLGPASYDLAYFQSSIPDSLFTAELASPELLIVHDTKAEALFQNKLWLWTIMTIMIAGLGLFTIKMMKR